jgi:toxin HigB-1
MNTIVVISNKARKQLPKLPKSIQSSFAAWILNLEIIGLEETRKIPGYHDEPLKSPRVNQRSVRLSKANRVFYEIFQDTVRVIHIIEVNKHKY